jgi:hypothetical protein
MLAPLEVFVSMGPRCTPSSNVAATSSGLHTCSTSESDDHESMTDVDPSESVMVASWSAEETLRASCAAATNSTASTGCERSSVLVSGSSIRVEALVTQVSKPSTLGSKSSEVAP